MTLAVRILRVLNARPGVKLSKLEIAGHLDIRTDGPGARHTIEELSRELLAMADAGVIKFEYPNAARPEFHFWVEAPPVEAAA